MAHQAAARRAGPEVVQRHQPAAFRAAAGSSPEQKASCPVGVVSDPAAVAAVCRAQHWAMPPPAAVQQVAARQEASVPDASVAVPDASVGFRQAALPAPDGLAVPPLGALAEEGEAAALDASRRVEEAVASDAAAVPQPVAGAASDVTAVLPQGAAAARDEEVAAEAAPHAAAVPGEAAAPALAAVLRVVAEARAVAVPRQAEVPGAAQALPAARPSAAAWACRQDRLRPAAPRSRVGLASVRSVPEARSAHVMRCLLMQCLLTASRSARLSQAAQDGIWSWRSLFLESLL